MKVLQLSEDNQEVLSRKYYYQDDIENLYILALIQSSSAIFGQDERERKFTYAARHTLQLQAHEAANLLKQQLNRVNSHNYKAAHEIEHALRNLGMTEQFRRSLEIHRWTIFAQDNAPSEFALAVAENDYQLLDPREAGVSKGNGYHGENAVDIANVFLDNPQQTPYGKVLRWYLTAGPINDDTSNPLKECRGEEVRTWLTNNLPIARFEQRLKQAEFVHGYCSNHDDLIHAADARDLLYGARAILKDAKATVRKYGSLS